MSWLSQANHAPASNAIAELLAAKRREIQTEHLYHDGDNRRKFVSQTAVYELWHRSEIRQIFSRWTNLDTERLLKLHIISFTILVFIGWPIDREIFRSVFLRDSHLDEKLPFTRDQLVGLDETFVELFVDRQYIFQPCIIRRSRRARVDYMDVNQPWPFVDEPKQIGCGGYGDVWQAKIAKGCYTNETDSDNMVNLNEKIVAYKQFRQGRDYHKEVQSLDYLRESLINHEHIAVHLAAIVHGKSDFFIFFELTPLGDLEILLNGGEEPNMYKTGAPGIVKYDFGERFPQVRKVNFVEELANIASALEYLHETLARTTTMGVYCAHMDLRPKNILVYPRSTGAPNIGKWVLADFGISSFKHREPGQRSLDFRTMGDFALETSRTGPHNLQGTHRAPELHELSDRKRYPGRKCDIWSFGCISNEVLAFLLGGLGESGVQSAAQALREFRRQKNQAYSDDYWFEHETPKRTMSKSKLRTSVATWLTSVPTAVGQEQPEHAQWIDNFVELLYKTLNITPEMRPLASDIGFDLREIIQLMETASDSKPWASPDLSAGIDDESTFATQEQGTRTIDDIFNTNAGFNSPLGTAYDDSYSSSPGSNPMQRFAENEDTTGPTSFPRSDADSYAPSPYLRSTGRLLIPRPRPISHDNSSDLPPSASGNGNMYGTSPGSIGPLSPLVTRLRLAQRGGLPENVLTSSGSEASGPSNSDEWSLSTGPKQPTPRSLSPKSTDRRHNPAIVKLGRRVQSWQFESPPNIKVFEIGPAGDRAAFILRDGSEWKLSILDLTSNSTSLQEISYVDMPDTIQWDRLSVTSRYIIAAGKVGQRREGRMIDVQEDRQIYHPSGWAWPDYPCTRMTPSARGVFAWTSGKRSLQIWDPQDLDTTPVEKTFHQDIDHICFNSTGTCLFVWARAGSTHYIYSFNMFDTRAAPLCTSFHAKLVRPSTKISMWAAQSDHACLVEEFPSSPRTYVRFDEKGVASPRELPEISLVGESSVTALCNSWVATAKVTGLYNKKLTVGKRYFSLGAGGDLGHTEEEIVLGSDAVKVKDKAGFRLAAFENETTDCVVICTQSGTVWRWESVPNERVRQRHGSFLTEGFRR